MPFVIAADSAARFAVFRVRDPYTVQEWRDATLTLFRDEVYRATGALLVDRRDAAPPPTLFVEEIVRFLSAHTHELPARVALVVRDEDAAFGMARMTELKSEATNLSVAMQAFRKYDDAVRWLTAGQDLQPGSSSR
jgi:hypothetical protein